MKKFIARLPGLIILVLLTPQVNGTRQSFAENIPVGIFFPFTFDSVAKGGIYQYGKLPAIYCAGSRFYAGRHGCARQHAPL